MSDLLTELRTLANQLAGLGDREAADLVRRAVERICALEERQRAGAGMLTGVILGEPASKANSRQLVRLGNRPAFIKSAKARAYEHAARLQLIAMRLEPIARPVKVTLRIFYRTQRPDLDESVVLDVLQGHAYENDRQVREKHVFHAIDRENPRTVFHVEALDDAA